MRLSAAISLAVGGAGVGGGIFTMVLGVEHNNKLHVFLRNITNKNELFKSVNK